MLNASTQRDGARLGRWYETVSEKDPKAKLDSDRLPSVWGRGSGYVRETLTRSIHTISNNNNPRSGYHAGRACERFEQVG